jgi:succinoglycan biosynthesis transport protein ExoP
MPTQQTPPVSLRELASTLFIYRGTIIALTVAFGLCAAIFSLLQSEVYEATVQIWAQDQSPGLRGSSNYPNDSAARLKIALTNVREVIYSRQVLETALVTCGLLEPVAGELSPAAQKGRDELIGCLSKSIRLEAPKGTDFGSTQIFFIRLRDRDDAHATQLLTAVLEAFRKRYEQLSAEQAQHLVDETTMQVQKSREQLDSAASAFDRCVQTLEGGLGELSSMGGSGGGESELRRSLTQLNERLVPAQADLKVQQAFLKQLRRARADKDEIVNVPGTVIREYPSLEQSVRDLGSARSQMDAVAARLTPENPEYQSAEVHWQLVEQTFESEVDRAVSAIGREIEAKYEAVQFMQTQKNAYLERIANLTNRYVEFDGLRQELAQRRTIVADAEKRRSDAAHALLTAAQETLFATLDGPRAGPNPVSPKRKANFCIGTLLGLITGVGMAFLARQFSQIVRSENDLNGISDDLLIVSIPKVRKPLQMVN